MSPSDNHEGKSIGLSVTNDLEGGELGDIIKWRSGGVSIATEIWCYCMVAMGGKVEDLMAPTVPELREAVDEEDRWAMAKLRYVHVLDNKPNEPTTPLRCGHDMEVPDIRLNIGDFVLVLPASGIAHAARMPTPGPIMSGFRIPGLTVFGPREENAATDGAKGSPITVPLNSNAAIGVRVELMYALICSPAA
ncbi:hypothetical protein Ccrd_009997 [Cynara cardunculus var. scolymus]|uniref:Uncharacterized protein n=1 Tax=Cynara cardunculus var. scolymus TaxID=59895 RepID=A0A124SI51_CYNCS|nr:hypothetical protein Ccrd_009997 [Cynara cardunculus var. scolymus]